MYIKKLNLYIMKKILVEGDAKLKNTGGKQYSMVVGRFQPFHDGHKWLINQCLDEGKNVLICIRDIKPDEKNPFTAAEVEQMIKQELWRYLSDEKIKIMIIPDIESVNFGRSVGYDIIEHVPPQEISEISATKIRQQLKIDPTK
jgi:cytidyltransferase-like protein